MNSIKIEIYLNELNEKIKNNRKLSDEYAKEGLIGLSQWYEGFYSALEKVKEDLKDY